MIRVPSTPLTTQAASPPGKLLASSHLTHVRSGLGRNRGIVISGIATFSLTAVR